MPRNAIFETVRYGVETTPGSAVTVTSNLQTISIQPTNKTAISKFRPAGSKVDTVLALGREWTEFSLESTPCYEEVGLIFDSLIAKNSGGVTTMKTTEPNSPATYTFEVGTGSNCVKFGYGLIHSATLKWTPDEIKITGEGFGQKMTSTTATSISETADMTPIQAGQVVISVDGTELKGANGTVFEAELTINKNWEMVKGIDNAGTGFKTNSELGPEMTFTLTLEADASGLGFLNTLRDDNATRLFAITATDGTNTFKVELGGKVAETRDYGETDGVTTIGYVFSVVTEESLGSPIKITVS